MLAPLLAALVLVGYALSLWWLLRGESARALVWVVGLTGLSVCLRLLYTTEYPNGLNEDEVKILWCSLDLLRGGHIFVDDCTGIPALLSVLFDAQLAEWIGPSRWAVRGLSFLGGTLAVPAAYAAARSLGLRVAPAVAAAGFVAVLPWALLYGRVHQSGELVFETLLLSACLARFLRARGGWQEALIGGFALTLLLQTYYSGRTMMGLALVTVVLAPGIRYRLYALAVVAIAALGYLPYWASGASYALVGVSGTFVQPGMAEDPLVMLQQKTLQALEALLAPVAYDQWLTIRAAAMHPIWILVMAIFGSVTLGLRRLLFLWAGFLGGLAPAIIGYSPAPSVRRMLLAFPFICLAAASSLDVIPWRKVRAVAAFAVFAVTAVASVRLFFSSEFWRPESLWVFDANRWNLIESLPAPPHPRLIVSRDFGYFFSPRAQVYRNFEMLGPDNFYPPNHQRAIYAFGPDFGMLQPLYMSLFGPDRVRSFGRSFTVAVDERDWTWLRQYGWSYGAHCGESVVKGQVPSLVLRDIILRDEQCPTPVSHSWTGRWIGPASKLRLYSRGEVSAAVDGVEVGRGNAYDVAFDFPVQTGSRVTVRLTPLVGTPMHLSLLLQTLAGEQAPPFEWVTPD